MDDFFNENLDDDFVGLPNDLGLGSDLIDIFSGIMPDMGHGGLDPDPGDHNHPSHMRQSPDDMNKAGTGSGTADLQDSAEIKLLQQPLAMGFLVSTSSPGPLPRWFWSSCPGREHHSPVCFKVRIAILLCLPSKHKTLVQHCTNVIQMFYVYWVILMALICIHFQTKENTNE